MVGEETLGDVAVVHLHGAGILTDEAEDVPKTSTFEHEFWIGVEDNLLQKALWHQVYEEAGQDAPTGVLTATMIISGYNVPVQVDLPPQVTGPVAASGGNLRSGPGTAFPVVGSVKAGDALETTGRNKAGDWAFVRTADGTEAWIAAFLIENVQVADLPEKAAPEPPPSPTSSTTSSAPTSYQGVPLMPGALRWGEDTMDLESGPQPVFFYIVPASADEVKDWYDARMAQNGWPRTMGFSDDEGGYFLVYGVEGEVLTVIISPVSDAGGTQILLSFL